MNIIFFDEERVRQSLLPLSFTRPVADFRVGITTIREKWERVVDGAVSYLTADYLSEKFPLVVADDNLFIAGNVCPSYSAEFAAKVNGLQSGEALVCDSQLVAFRGTMDDFEARKFVNEYACEESLSVINRPYDIFIANGRQIIADYAVMDVADCQPLSAINMVIGPTVDEAGRPMVYVAPGATVEGAIFNTKKGPIVIGADAEVMEGSCLRGPVALGEHAVINMGTMVYPDTTIGPWCKVGGELNNAVFFGYSNKAHDGFLGNAVIGEWCNLGADTVASNLKNDYSFVRVWNYATESFERTSHQFCGLIMGDHSKAGINTMFNTATVVGVGCNIHGAGFPRTYIPSFSIGGAAGIDEIPLQKFFDTATRVMSRRGKSLTDADRALYTYLHTHRK